MRGPCRARILGFVGADEEGFWEVPGPERLMFLCSKRALQGHREVCHQASDLRRAMAESDVLGGALDEGLRVATMTMPSHKLATRLMMSFALNCQRPLPEQAAVQLQRSRRVDPDPGGGVDLQPAAPPSDIAADPDPEPVKDELDLGRICL